MLWWRKIRISGSTGRENPEKPSFWSTYRESSYHTFDNSVVRHIRCLPRNLNGIFSSQMVKRSMGEPFWKGRLNGLIRLLNDKYLGCSSSIVIYYNGCHGCNIGRDCPGYFHLEPFLSTDTEPPELFKRPLFAIHVVKASKRVDTAKTNRKMIKL